MAIRLELAVSHALEHKSDVQYSVPVGLDQWMSSQITILFEKIIGSNGVCGLLLRINVYDFNQTKKTGSLVVFSDSKNIRAGVAELTKGAVKVVGPFATMSTDALVWVVARAEGARKILHPAP